MLTEAQTDFALLSILMVEDPAAHQADGVNTGLGKLLPAFS
jgi:hypothetical protein